jgi:hypothetical protein
MTKTLNKLRIEEKYLNIINSMYGKSLANIIANREELKIVPLKSGKRQGYPPSPLFYNIVLEFLA